MGTGLTTLSHKTSCVTETATKESATTVCDGLRESLQEARMYSSGESRKRATDRKMEVLNVKNKTRIHGSGDRNEDPEPQLGHHREIGQ